MKNGLAFTQIVTILMLANGLMNHVIVIPMMLDSAKRDSWISVLFAGALYLIWTCFLYFIYLRTGREHLFVWLQNRYGFFVSRLLALLTSLLLYYREDDHNRHGHLDQPVFCSPDSADGSHCPLRRFVSRQRSVRDTLHCNDVDGVVASRRRVFRDVHEFSEQRLPPASADHGKRDGPGAQRHDVRGKRLCGTAPVFVSEASSEKQSALLSVFLAGDVAD